MRKGYLYRRDPGVDLRTVLGVGLANSPWFACSAEPGASLSMPSRHTHTAPMPDSYQTGILRDAQEVLSTLFVEIPDIRSSGFAHN